MKLESAPLLVPAAALAAGAAGLDYAWFPGEGWVVCNTTYVLSQEGDLLDTLACELPHFLARGEIRHREILRVVAEHRDAVCGPLRSHVKLVLRVAEAHEAALNLMGGFAPQLTIGSVADELGRLAGTNRA